MIQGFVGAILASALITAVLHGLVLLFKGLKRFLMVVAVPLFWSTNVQWVRWGIDKATAVIQAAGLNVQALTFTGLAAWVMEQLRFVDCLGLIVTAVGIVMVNRVVFGR